MLAGQVQADDQGGLQDGMPLIQANRCALQGSPVREEEPSRIKAQNNAAEVD